CNSTDARSSSPTRAPSVRICRTTTQASRSARPCALLQPHADRVAVKNDRLDANAPSLFLLKEERWNEVPGRNPDVAGARNGCNAVGRRHIGRARLPGHERLSDRPLRGRLQREERARRGTRRSEGSRQLRRQLRGRKAARKGRLHVGKRSTPRGDVQERQGRRTGRLRVREGQALRGTLSKRQARRRGRR